MLVRDRTWQASLGLVDGFNAMLAAFVVLGVAFGWVHSHSRPRFWLPPILSTAVGLGVLARSFRTYARLVDDELEVKNLIRTTHVHIDDIVACGRRRAYLRGRYLTIHDKGGSRVVVIRALPGSTVTGSQPSELLDFLRAQNE